MVIPFQRDKKYGDRQFMTEAEHKQALDDLAKRNARVGRDNQSRPRHGKGRGARIQRFLVGSQAERNKL